MFISNIIANAADAESAVETVSGVQAKLMEYGTKGLDALVAFAPKVLIGIVVVWLGWKLANLIAKMVNKALKAKKIDDSLIPFITSLVATILKLVVAIAAIDIIGVKTTSFVAVLGAAGLAVGMALSGTLQNFAGGVMILVFRPFNVGDYISAQDKEGVVQEIQIFQTLILTNENKSVYIPNGPLSTGSITNFHKEGSVRVEAKIGVSYSSNIDDARKVALATVSKDDRLNGSDPLVAVTELGDSAVNLSVFVWTHPDNYWNVLFETQENLKKAFDEAGIKIPFPQRDVHVHTVS